MPVSRGSVWIIELNCTFWRIRLFIHTIVRWDNFVFIYVLPYFYELLLLKTIVINGDKIFQNSLERSFLTTKEIKKSWKIWK
jgi:uncharacterized membrane protein